MLQDRGGALLEVGDRPRDWLLDAGNLPFRQELADGGVRLDRPLKLRDVPSPDAGSGVGAGQERGVVVRRDQEADEDPEAGEPDDPDDDAGDGDGAAALAPG